VQILKYIIKNVRERERGGEREGGRERERERERAFFKQDTFGYYLNSRPFILSEFYASRALQAIIGT